LENRRTRLENSVTSTILSGPSTIRLSSVFLPAKFFGGKKFKNEANISQAVLEFFASKDESFYRNVILQNSRITITLGRGH
ncbi:hypothetical protein NL489_27120, partial [Klebsiella pneumoniae]|nr:hypothetical protein [Klebsiella pneumoniae]